MNDTDELKISEMEEAEEVNNEDLIMIVQDGRNKKTKAKNVGVGGEATGDTLPIGATIEWYSDIIPENWLLCDGQAVSRIDYSELFNVLGIRYGQGDGNTTFNLPNLRGKGPIGKDENDNDFNELGKIGGEKEHTLTITEMPDHSHKADSLVYWGNTAVNGLAGASGTYWTVGNRSTESTGGNQPHNNLQPHIVCNFIIKAKQSSGLVATVVDNLNSTSETDALSARQGKKLLEEIKKLEGIVLYDNAEGTTGDITLSESIADFTDIEIFYFDSHSLCNNVKIYQPNGKRADLSTFHAYSESGTVIADTRAVTITENKIKNGTQDDVGVWTSWNNNIEKTNVIKIYKVIGHR